MAGKVRHLLLRDHRYYARVAVPKELRPLMPSRQRELTKALGADRSEALRTLPAAVAGMQAMLADARQRIGGKTKAPPRGVPLTVREMALAHYDEREQNDQELRNTDHRYASFGFIPEDYVQALKRAMTGAAPNDELQQTVGRIVHKFQNAGNTTAQRGTPEWRELARALAGVEFEALRRTVERDEGDIVGEPTHPLLQPLAEAKPGSEAHAHRLIGPHSTKPLSAIVPMLLAEKGARGSTMREYEVAARIFEEHLEEAKPIYKITRHDVLGYKNALLKTPSNYTKRFPGMTLPQAIAANELRTQPFPTLSPKTINDKALPWLNSAFKWAVNNEVIPDNPAAGVKIERKRFETAPSREHFTPGDLARIFAPPEFSAGQALGERHWAMLIALFSGMRAGEIAQLKLDSVRTERGVLAFAIEEETKTRGSRRITPVHSTLIALGLLDRVADLRRKRETHLFPDWYGKAQTRIAGAGRDVNTPYSQIIPRWFNRTYLPRVGIHDDQKVFHCFRHTLKTALSRAGISRTISDQITGHEDSSVGGKYIHENSIEAMKEALEKIHFDGLSLH
jgi:integrase